MDRKLNNIRNVMLPVPSEALSTLARHMQQWPHSSPSDALTDHQSFCCCLENKPWPDFSLFLLPFVTQHRGAYSTFSRLAPKFESDFLFMPLCYSSSFEKSMHSMPNLDRLTLLVGTGSWPRGRRGTTRQDDWPPCLLCSMFAVFRFVQVKYFLQVVEDQLRRCPLLFFYNNNKKKQSSGAWAKVHPPPPGYLIDTTSFKVLHTQFKMKK